MSRLQHFRASEFASSISNSVYLNHAASSPSPTRVQTALTDAVVLNGRDPEAFFMQVVMPSWEACRKGLALLMGVDSESIAITRNTGHGLSITADAMALEPGDNVIVADCEYPAVTYPWFAQSWRGVETRVLAAGPAGDVTAEKVSAAMDGRTRAVALSWVQFGTGYRADIGAIAEVVHANGALLIIDVIQGLGALQFEHGANVDVIATGAHKWLMSPHGNGALYIAPNCLDRFRLVNMGALSVENPFQFDPLTFKPKATARRYEEGSPNALGLAGMAAALSLIEEAGIAEIEEQVLSLSRYATEQLLALGCAVDSPLESARASGLVLFRHPTIENDTVLANLRAATVRASIRGGRVRLSPHFYNTMEDIDVAVGALAAGGHAAQSAEVSRAQATPS